MGRITVAEWVRRQFAERGKRLPAASQLDESDAGAVASAPPDEPGSNPGPLPTPAPQFPTADPATSQRDAFLRCLRAQKGKPYVWGASGPDRFDCSGLTRYCYMQATGKVLSPDSHEQAKTGVAVAKADVQPGDILLFDTANGTEVRGGNAVSHVGVATGPDTMISALNLMLGVGESDLRSAYWTSQVRYLGARRLPFAGAASPKVPARPVSASDEFRTLPTISRERFAEILKGYPMEAEAGAIHDALGGRPLALAQSFLESSYGRSENAQKTKNALGLMDYSGRHPVVWVGPNLPLRKFNSWAEGFAEWARRVDDPNYPGGGG